MTTQSGKDAGTGGGSKDAPIVVDADDLDLIDNDLEDEGKSDQEVWNELDAAEGEKAAGEEGADKAATKDDDAGSDAAADTEEAVEDEPDKSAAAAADKRAAGEDTEHAKDGNGATDKKAAQAAGAEPTLAELKAELGALKREQQAKIDRAVHAARSDLGRQLRRELGGGQPPGAKKPVASGPKKPFQTDKGKDFAKEYPEVAAPVAAELEEVRSELDELKAERARREQAETSARLIKNEEVLDKAHPKWEETAATNEFGDWLLKQPAYVQAAVKRNFDAIVDAQEAVDIFDRFQAFRSSQAGGDNTQQQGKGKANAQDGPDGKREQADGKNGSLSGKRQRQLESSSGARSTGPGLVDGVPEDGDYEATWKAMDREDERKERQARRA